MYEYQIKRSIAYVKDNEDDNDLELDFALSSTLEERMIAYYQLLKANYAVSGFDLDNLKVQRTIQYADD